MPKRSLKIQVTNLEYSKGRTMLNQIMLREKMKEQRYNIRTLCKAIPMSEPAMSRKIHGNVDFKSSEIERIAELLGLTDAELIAIFFDRK